MGGSMGGSMGTPPDFGSSDTERPTPPDRSSESGEGSSEESGERPERPSDVGQGMGGGPGGGGGPQSESESSEAETNAVTTNFVSLDELDQKVWIELGGSVLLLAAAIVIAMRYHKR